MINLSKKKMGALAVGAVMTFGAAFPALTFAASQNDAYGSPYDCYQGQGIGGHHKNGMFAEMEKELNISKADFDNYRTKGYSGRDVMHAAIIAKASGKSLDKVISYKTADTTWHYVMGKVNVTDDQLRQVHQDLFTDGISQRTGVDKSAITNLFKQGYNGRDIMIAAELSKVSSKSIDDVMAMKKVNNTWKDVADSLGVNRASFRQDFGPMHDGPMHGNWDR
ncbi:hypothetical protein [Pectinatus frisingensis]|uniref:hypothetical protein n=1 Tax=Pectinatus frisingensis TaxID=865 RepID=UPI0018C7D4C1|nr:hypothetical protein [Pectinatus frisingensis]